MTLLCGKLEPHLQGHGIIITWLSMLPVIAKCEFQLFVGI